MYYYDYKATVSSAYDTNPLMVVGYIKVYLDEAKTQYFTEIPFPSFPFAEITDKTQEGFDNYVTQKVNDVVNSQDWQTKLDELKTAYDMGIYVPQS